MPSVTIKRNKFSEVPLYIVFYSCLLSLLNSSHPGIGVQEFSYSCTYQHYFIVIIWQDRIIARLQRPYSLDCIPVEVEYQVGDHNLSFNQTSHVF